VILFVKVPTSAAPAASSHCYPQNERVSPPRNEKAYDESLWWWALRDSNPRPLPRQESTEDALTSEWTGRVRGETTSEREGSVCSRML
jgi:hypothetical protein